MPIKLTEPAIEFFIERGITTSFHFRRAKRMHHMSDPEAVNYAITMWLRCLLNQIDIFPGSHWIWLGYQRAGYGFVRLGDKQHPVHRLLKELSLYRSLTPGMCACHKQECTIDLRKQGYDIGLCVNPEHVYEGTARQNLQDRWAITATKPVPLLDDKGRQIFTDERRYTAILPSDADIAAALKVIEANKL